MLRGMDAAPWSMGQRLTFRFFAAYFVLYTFPWPVGDIPGTSWLRGVIGRADASFVTWVGDRFLGVTAIQHPTGSGDTLFDFVALFRVAVLALLLSTIWSLADRASRDHRVLHEILRVYLRFFLADMMLSYGLAKVWKSQFPEPTAVRLFQPFGAATPPGLLWTFMGASTPYTIFGGLSEAVGGVLLLFRRTASLGALVVAGVMANVVLLNYSYDVAVKLFSSNLLLLALFLAAPDVPRLLAVLVLNRATQPGERAWPRSARGRRIGQVIGLLFATFLLYRHITEKNQDYHEYGDGSPPEELYGVEAMIPGPRWKVVGFRSGTFSMLSDADSVQRLRCKLGEHALILNEFLRPVATYVLHVERPAADRLFLVGKFRGELVVASLKRIERPDFTLRETFHWVQEFSNIH
jgi:uncharacterized membrane protein YphA (DoxX/SURF4 family)